MQRIVVIAAVVLCVCVAAVAAHMALIEIGRDVVVLHKWTAAGNTHRTRLWIVDEGDHSWLHHAFADSEWFQHLATDPIVTLERDGVVRHYRATPDPQSHDKVHELLRAKYGLANAWVRLLAGDAQHCNAIPVRLDPVQGGS